MAPPCELFGRYLASTLSINSGGHRGVLSEVSADAIDEALNAILAGKYVYDPRIRIQASVNGRVFPPALNDILIVRVSLTRTPLLSIMLMGDKIKQRMDGTSFQHLPVHRSFFFDWGPRAALKV